MLYLTFRVWSGTNHSLQGLINVIKNSRPPQSKTAASGFSRVEKCIKELYSYDCTYIIVTRYRNYA